MSGIGRMYSHMYSTSSGGKLVSVAINDCWRQPGGCGETPVTVTTAKRVQALPMSSHPVTEFVSPSAWALVRQQLAPVGRS